MHFLTVYSQSGKNGADLQVKTRILENVFKKRLLTQKRNLAAKLVRLSRLVKRVHESGDSKETRNPANINLFKVNNRNTRKRCKICLKLTIKRRH